MVARAGERPGSGADARRADRSPSPRYDAVVKATLVLAAALACAPLQRIPLRPVQALEGPDVTLLRFTSSEATGFRTPRGRACAPFGGAVKDDFAGWQSPTDDPACVHDSFRDGPAPGTLALRFRAEIPRDGDFELVQAGFALGSVGLVEARGSHFGDYVARATVEVEARAPTCSARWSKELAMAALTGPYQRSAGFSGWFHVSDLPLRGCKGGDRLELDVRLVAATTRGSIVVDLFGFSATRDEDLHRMFGLRPLAAASPPAAAPPPAADRTAGAR
jgi:hypothetical protein